FEKSPAFLVSARQHQEAAEGDVRPPNGQMTVRIRAVFPQSNGFAEEPFGDLLFAARICIQSQVHPDFGEVRVESTRHVQEAIRRRVISFYRFENAKQIVSEKMTRIELEFLRQLMADFRDRSPIICAKQSVGPFV